MLLRLYRRQFDCHNLITNIRKRTAQRCLLYLNYKQIERLWKICQCITIVKEEKVTIHENEVSSTRQYNTPVRWCWQATRVTSTIVNITRNPKSKLITVPKDKILIIPGKYKFKNSENDCVVLFSSSVKYYNNMRVGWFSNPSILARQSCASVVHLTNILSYVGRDSANLDSLFPQMIKNSITWTKHLTSV